MESCTGATWEREEGMEHKFGLFNTVEELNRAAANQKEEGDTEALYALAAENGIAREDVDDYLDGVADELATPLMAALGKLDLEAAALDLESQLADWKDYIAAMCTDSEEMSRAVFRPDRELAQVLADAIRHASANRVYVPGRITRLAGLPDRIPIGMTGRDELRRIAEKYYLDKETGK